MSLGAVRNLSPDFIRDVLPKLPLPGAANTAFNRSHVDENMRRTGILKNQALDTYWPQLKKSVSTVNIKIPMSDGTEVDLKIYTPTKEAPSSGYKQVVYS